MSKKVTTEDFIKKAREVHGDKYDYSKVKYKKTSEKVCIICSEHGEFWQTPNKHISVKHGCPKCAKNGVQLTTEEFIDKSRKVHGDVYDYSKTNYINQRTKVCIICKKHGDFMILPNNHYFGKFGCPICNQTNNITTEIFIKKSEEVHGNKYDYSKVDYEGCESKVIIICPIHGEFKQKAHHHLNGCGCPKCYCSKLEDSMREYLVKNNINFEEQKMFEWLKHNGNLRLDFYLPDYNIGIECQGEQHFSPVDFAGLGKDWAEKQLLITKSRDKIKKRLCEENGIKLLYYTDENKDSFSI